MAILIAVALSFILFRSGDEVDPQGKTDTINNQEMIMPNIYPVEHASFVMEWDGEIVYVDPVGEAASYTKEGLPNAVVITHGHGDHFDLPLLEEIVTENVVLVVTEEVFLKLPEALQAIAFVMKNDEVKTARDITFTAIAMYNLAPDKIQYHPKGVGNGYVLEKGGVRVYVAGDTEDIPEMRALQNIDIAFVPMNEPFTMSVEAAAAAVLEFAPSVVYPYHFRGVEGMSDIALFTNLVRAGNPDITVIAAEWYKKAEAE